VQLQKFRIFLRMVVENVINGDAVGFPVKEYQVVRWLALYFI